MSFAYEFYDSHRILMLHGTGYPDDAQWDEYLNQVRGRGELTDLGLLVFTNGGVPNAGQRRALNLVLDGRYFPRAIVHKSSIVRGVISAVGWFAPGVQAFDPRALPAAAEHARFEATELPALAVRVRKLHLAMGAPIPWLDEALHHGSTQPSQKCG